MIFCVVATGSFSRFFLLRSLHSQSNILKNSQNAVQVIHTNYDMTPHLITNMLIMELCVLYSPQTRNCVRRIKCMKCSKYTDSCSDNSIRLNVLVRFDCKCNAAAAATSVIVCCFCQTIKLILRKNSLIQNHEKCRLTNVFAFWPNVRIEWCLFIQNKSLKTKRRLGNFVKA